MKIALTADWHVHEISSNERLIKRLSIIRDANFDAMIACGDLTDDGMKGQYKILRMLLKQLDIPKIFLCPGNHDYAVLGNLYNANKKKLFDRYTGTGYSKKRIQYDRFHDINFIGVNSCLETVCPFDFAQGIITDEQIDELDKYLDDHKFFNVVYLHHHPFLHGNDLKLQNADKFMDCIAGRVSALFFGHDHVFGYWKNEKGIPLIVALDSLSQKADIVIFDTNRREITIRGVYNE